MSYNPLYVGQFSQSSARQLITNYTNNTGFAIPQGSPCSIQTDGTIALTDVTSQQSVQNFVGYAYARIANASSGPVISGGRLQNLMGYSFSVGDIIYISVGGSLQNTKPVDNNGDPVAPFVSGNFMVFVGCIVQNETDNAQQDLQIFTQDFGAI